ncbi:hypothetical protein DS2_10307 [Catenovulum agarivorans DS-2]|uniref:Integrase catalytic domain-containing protein n=1 Tax=Catenovulum agarivorans DS-2 TaxID=1328313 RepID=W7QX28_9ALTE|nr:DDE-type integrase/transposase/recombinase [Catenovulum agarivorans]EWH09835.1 hypothetical protein DS2_10307 [Catenovulum agarivorans DS-2]
MSATLNHEYFDALRNFALKLEKAAHGTKQSIISDALAYFGWSNHHKLYREMDKHGLKYSKRKTRSDKGKTAQDETALEMVAATLHTGSRSNGKQMMEVPNAISILSQNGYNFMSKSTVNRLLRERNMNAKAMQRDSAATQLRSLHPNHVHQIDPSLCVIYYDPESKKVKGSNVFQNLADESAFYKNKPDSFSKTAKLRVWRYVCTDHTSGHIWVKYYSAAGESMQLVADFILWCWIKQQEREAHGLPYILYVDRGTANIAKPVKRLCDSLNVDLRTHDTGNSRAKGQVENANNIVEKLFESRLLLEPVKSVDEMNDAVFAWQNAYNADLIPNYDAKLSRTNKSRLDVWRTIHTAAYSKHLRICPPEQICRYMLSYEPVERKVKNNYVITFVHPAIGTSVPYLLEGLLGVLIGEKVRVAPIILDGSTDILVFTKDPLSGKEIVHQVQVDERDEFGFSLAGSVIGEGYAALADDQIDGNKKAANALAYAGLSQEDAEKARKKHDTPFNGEINAHSHLKDIQHTAAFATKGHEIDVPEMFIPEKGEKRLDALDARMQISEIIDRPLSVAEAEWINDQEVYPSKLNEIAQYVKSGALSRPQLKVVGDH